SSRRRHTRFSRDWSSDVCSSDLPQVGRELRNRGILSIFYASIAVLIYIAFRFDSRFAPGAIVAMLHDVVVVLGYFVVTRREFNQIGRASCRERVESAVGARSLEA